MAQAYFNPEIIKVIKKLVSLVEMYDSSQRSLDKPSLDHFNIMRSAPRPTFIDVFNPYQCGHLPRNPTYKDLFKLLCKRKGLIPIALYRPTLATDNFLPYIVNNPRPDIELKQGDQVLVFLSDKKPTHTRSSVNNDTSPGPDAKTSIDLMNPS